MCKVLVVSLIIYFLHKSLSIVPGIIDLPKFNYQDLEEIVAAEQGSFGVNW